MKTNHTEQTEKSTNDKAAWHRRKRIKRMKIAIVVIAIMLLILPTLFCIFLGLKVGKLQNQVEELVSIHKEESVGFVKGMDEARSYAYAAERQANTGEPSDNSEALSETLPPIPESNQMASSTYTEDTIGKVVEETIDMTAESVEDQISSAVGQDNKPSTAVTGESKLEEGEIKIASTGIYAGKKVYLTFDDGPSIYTDEILDILDEYGVKATFFVIGKKDQESMRLYRKIIENGHTLGMHSYSHVYKQIYNSAEDFDKDFTKLWKLLYDTTGYMPTIYRFPGGSGNMVNKHGMEEFIRYLKDKAIVYYDWNVDNGDATGTEFTKEQLSDNILCGVAAKKRSIVLLHDAQGKQTTVDSLPAVLEALISGGAEVLPLTEEVTPIQQIKAEDVK